MRFFKNLYRSALVAVAGVLALASCQPEESPLARAIMTSVSGLQFAATGAEPQTITVYSDADWTVEAPEWVTVDVVSGTRTMDVTVSVGDNLRDGALDNPKKDTIVFKGYNLLATAYVIVSQDGDKYRDVPATDLAGILSMKDEAVVILDNALVTAVSANGFVVSDATTNVFVASKETVAVGDKINLKGSKGTLNGLAAVTICDGIEVVGNAAVTYPATSDITASLDAYAATKMEYVEVTGTLDGVNVAVEGAAKVAAVLDATTDLNLSSLNGHNVTIKGYSAGVTASLVNVIVTEIVDLGVDEIIYFSDNFDWLGEIALKEGAGDSVGTDDPEASAPNVFTMASADEFLSAFADQGYKFYWGTIGSSEFVEGPDPNKKDSRVMYIQRNYLKFGKTSWNGAITLPALSSIEGSANVVIEFDWCWQVTGSGKFKPDLMTLQIDATAGIFADSGTSTSVELESTQSTVEGESRLAWQHVKVILNGANSETVLMIRPTNADPDVQNPARHQNRWYLDNIKIIDAGGAPVTPPSGGGSSVFSDNFDWVQPFVEADIAKGGTQGDSMLDNAQYTVGSSYNLEGFEAAFTEQGYEALFPDSKAIYVMQGNYLKFSKGKNTNGIRLPVMDFGGATTVELSFDWGINVGSGGPDDVKLEVEVEGNGNINGASKSSPLIHSAGDWEWQTEVVTITGVDNETRITIKPTAFTGVVDASGYYRWFLDNVNVNVK